MNNEVFVQLKKLKREEVAHLNEMQRQIDSMTTSNRDDIALAADMCIDMITLQESIARIDTALEYAKGKRL